MDTPKPQAYRVWVAPEMKIYVTRDVKFFDEPQAREGHSDHTRGSSDKHFSVSDEQQTLEASRETEIGGNLQSNPNDWPSDENTVILPITEDNENAGDDTEVGGEPAQQIINCNADPVDRGKF